MLELYNDKSKLAPREDFVVSYWSPCALDALSVQIVSDTEYHAVIPVIPTLALHTTNVSSTKRSHGCPTDARDTTNVNSTDWSHGCHTDLSWLAALISRRAHDLFLSHYTKINVRSDESIIWNDLERHKKTLLDLDGHATLLKQANSDRPAFTIMSNIPCADRSDTSNEEDIDGNIRKLSHTYCAMGLEHQHDKQQTILCRIYDVNLVSCFVKAVYSTLSVGLRLSCVRAESIEKVDKRTAAVDALTRSFRKFDVHFLLKRTQPPLSSLRDSSQLIEVEEILSSTYSLDNSTLCAFLSSVLPGIALETSFKGRV